MATGGGPGYVRSIIRRGDAHQYFHGECLRIRRFDMLLDL
jgi:hypothetical protein